MNLPVSSLLPFTSSTVLESAFRLEHFLHTLWQMKSVSFGGELEFSVLRLGSGVFVFEWHPHRRSWVLGVGSNCRSPWLASPSMEASSLKLGQGLLTGAPIFLTALSQGRASIWAEEGSGPGLGNACWNLASATGFWRQDGNCWCSAPPGMKALLLGTRAGGGGRTLCFWLHQRGVEFLSPRPERG